MIELVGFLSAALVLVLILALVFAHKSLSPHQGKGQDMADLHYHVDFDNILEVALKGVRRGTAFLGLGINASTDPNFKQYQLTDVTHIQLLPADLSEQSISHLKEEFGTWVVGNGLRELIETFSVFLDQIHHACIAIASSGEESTKLEIDKKQSSFAMRGFPKKLKILNNSYSVSPSNSDYLRTLNQARNCLTHRRGVVARVDCNKSDKLSIDWLGVHFLIVEPNGSTHVIDRQIEEGIYLRDGGKLKLKTVERSRRFAVGDLVKFSTKDLAEICWFVLREAQATITSAVEYAKNKGVQVNDPSPHLERPNLR